MGILKKIRQLATPRKLRRAMEEVEQEPLAPPKTAPIVPDQPLAGGRPKAAIKAEPQQWRKLPLPDQPATVDTKGLRELLDKRHSGRGGSFRWGDNIAHYVGVKHKVIETLIFAALHPDSISVETDFQQRVHMTKDTWERGKERLAQVGLRVVALEEHPEGTKVRAELELHPQLERFLRDYKPRDERGTS